MDELKFRWSELPYLIKEKILNMTTDEEKVDLLDVFPMVTTLIASFVFDYDNQQLSPSPQRMDIFSKCGKVSNLVLRMKPPFDNEFNYVSLMKSVALINPNLSTINFEVNSLKGPSNVAINCYDSKLIYLRMDYIEAVLNEDPFYDGRQFINPVLLCNRSREIESIYPNLKLNYRILFLKNENYSKFSDEMMKKVTEIDAGFNYGHNLDNLIARCPNLSKIELLLSDNLDDYRHILAIETLTSIICWSSKDTIKNVNNLLEIYFNSAKLTELTLLGLRSKRIFQVKNHLVIVNSKINDFLIKELINKFDEKITKVVHESIN